MRPSNGPYTRSSAVVAAIVICPSAAFLLWLGCFFIAGAVTGGAIPRASLAWICAVPAVAGAIALGRKIVHADFNDRERYERELAARTGRLGDWLYAAFFLLIALGFWGGSAALIAMVIIHRERGGVVTLFLMAFSVVVPLFALGWSSAMAALRRVRRARGQGTAAEDAAAARALEGFLRRRRW